MEGQMEYKFFKIFTEFACVVLSSVCGCFLFVFFVFVVIVYGMVAVIINIGWY